VTVVLLVPVALGHLGDVAAALTDQAHRFGSGG